MADGATRVLAGKSREGLSPQEAEDLGWAADLHFRLPVCLSLLSKLHFYFSVGKWIYKDSSLVGST